MTKIPATKTPKPKKEHYFNSETEKAVMDYINEPEQHRKSRIFNTYLYTPLLKLSEVLINSGNYPYALAAADPDGSSRSQFRCLQHQAICHILSIFFESFQLILMIYYSEQILPLIEFFSTCPRSSEENVEKNTRSNSLVNCQVNP